MFRPVNRWSKISLSQPVIHHVSMSIDPDWKKLYTAFDPFRPLRAGDPAWVDCASARGDEDILEGLGLEIQRSNNVTCQLYAGHRGAGKSTELLRLQHYLQDQGFRVIYFEADDNLEPQNTEYSDILLACARQVISRLRSPSIKDDKFRVWVDQLLRNLRDLGVTELSLDELSYESPETPLARVSAAIMTNVSKQQLIRRQVDQQSDSLIKILNEFIREAMGDQPMKSLVLIVDNLDRIVERYEGENLPSNYEQIFVNHSDQLCGLSCHVIYTVPISLAYSFHLSALEQSYKPIQVLPMVMLRNPDGTVCEEGVAKMKELIRQRFKFAGGGQSLEEVFESAEALMKLCEMSGGHPRNLISLMKAALQHTTEFPIKTKSVQRAVSELRDTYRKIIDGHEWETLAQVAEEKVITANDDLFRSLLFRRCILEYRYIDDEGKVQVWHDVHPLVRGIEGFKRALSRTKNHENKAKKKEEAFYRFALSKNSSPIEQIRYYQQLELIKNKRSAWKIVDDIPKEDEIKAVLIIKKGENYVAQHGAYIINRSLGEMLQQIFESN
jgi:AAA ATPase domain